MIASLGTGSVLAPHAAPMEGTRPGVAGRLQAVFSLRDAGPLPGEVGTPSIASRTVARVSSIGPLEMRRPVIADDRFFLRNVTAGVFGGDAYDVALTCEAGVGARVESTSATKVYAMPGSRATSHVRLRAEAGSRLVWGPHTTILLGDSEYSNETSVVLAGGIVIAAETVVMGRLAAGEAFEFRSYDVSLIVRDEGGRARFTERAKLLPQAALRDAMAGRGGLSTVYGLGVVVDEGIRQRLTDRTLAFDFAGWSELPNGAGLVAKALVRGASEGETFARKCINALM
jgi:urease accessory protein